MQMNEARLANANASAGVGPAIPASPVENELDRIDNGLMALDAEVGNLCARINSVLEPEQTAKQESDAGAIRSVERSWLHGSLRDKADRIERLAAVLNDLRNRVTL